MASNGREKNLVVIELTGGNDSGTDHCSGGVTFVVGGQVNGGMHGAAHL